MVISLFPFLSILACLIGALVLMIVVLTVTQTQEVDGKTQEEVDRAKAYIEFEKQLAQDNATVDELETAIDEAQKVDDELDRAKKMNTLLRNNLKMPEEKQKENKRVAAELQQRLENLQADLDSWPNTKKGLDEQIKELTAKLAELNKKPDDTAPPIIVIPSGSGSKPGTKYFFAEANRGGIKALRSFDDNLKVTDTVRAAGNSIGVDEGLNDWLNEVADVKDSKIIILVRDGGHWTSSQLRNYAMSPDHPYQIPVARLPLPGAGDADLNAFKDVLGKFPPKEKSPKGDEGGGKNGGE